jgi:hypothetical protein
MVDAAIERQLVACLSDLPLSQQRQVLEFARTLQERTLVGVPGAKLIKFAGAISDDDLTAMSNAITAGCEEVDADEW